MRRLWRRQCLHEYVATDPLGALKRWETAEALRDLPAVLASLDQLPTRERLRQLMRQLLAGNMFDWGAHAVVVKLEAATLTFEAAGEAVLHSDELDHSERFFDRLEGPNAAYRRAVIFVDNAGYDITLGVLPFVRELLKRGTQVVLAANSLPALNDITYRELLGLVDAVAQNDAVFHDAVRAGCDRDRSRPARVGHAALVRLRTHADAG